MRRSQQRREPLQRARAHEVLAHPMPREYNGVFTEAEWTSARRDVEQLAGRWEEYTYYTDPGFDGDGARDVEDVDDLALRALDTIGLLRAMDPQRLDQWWNEGPLTAVGGETGQGTLDDEDVADSMGIAELWEKKLAVLNTLRGKSDSEAGGRGNHIPHLVSLVLAKPDWWQRLSVTPQELADLAGDIKPEGGDDVLFYGAESEVVLKLLGAPTATGEAPREFDGNAFVASVVDSFQDGSIFFNTIVFAAIAHPEIRTGLAAISGFQERAQQEAAAGHYDAALLLRVLAAQDVTIVPGRGIRLDQREQSLPQLPDRMAA